MTLKRVIRSPFLWAFVIGILSLHIIKELALMRRAAPEPLVMVPDWTLIDQNGASFSKSRLLGKIYIADFFFTSCPSICPKLTDAMKEVYSRFSSKTNEVHFLSISVDPDTDTPTILNEFMKKNNIEHANWHCLTGTNADVYDVVVQKMRVHMGEKEILSDADGIYDIPHLAQLALFDQNGDLRGLFKTDSMELSALVRAANFLLEKK